MSLYFEGRSVLGGVIFETAVERRRIAGCADSEVSIVGVGEEYKRLADTFE